MNLKPNELALLAAGTITPDVSLRAADELAKLLPNIGRAAAAIQASYDARQNGALPTDYDSLERCRQALQTFHGRVAGRLTPRGQTLNLTEIDKSLGAPEFIRDLLAAPLTKAEVSARLEALCKIIDDPKRAADRPFADVKAKQLAGDVARLGGLSATEANDRVAEVVSGASPAILFQPPKFSAPENVHTASPNKPLFSTVTGRDFGRAIRWARSVGNPLTEAIRNAAAAKKEEASRPTNELPAGSLRAQLATRPAPARPVTVAQTSASAAVALRPSIA